MLAISSRTLVLGALAITACQPAAKAPSSPGPRVAAVDAARLVAAPNDAANWLTHGRTYDEQRYSPLSQVTADNVKQLGLAWYLDLDTDRGQEATPLVIDGVMYSTSAWSKVQAVDAATGKELWQYDPRVPGETGVRACCDVVNRGVAAWNGRVYVATLDGRLIALDAATGKPIWSVVTVEGPKYTITAAPRIVKGKVLIGNAGAEFGVRGYISAYDADTGKLVWRFYTVPGDPSKPFETPVLKQAATTWSGDWWKQGGGGTVWDSVAYDPELDLLYIGTGNGSPWNQRVRSANTGDNLFLSSIVALRPDTGEYVWHYQETPGDQWDYTATQHIVLANLMIDGQPRKVLMQAPKNGFFYVLDRVTGKLISADPYAMLNWAKGVDPNTGRPNIDPNAFYSKTGKPWLAMPGPYGAHNWQPMSFSPQTGLVYIPALDSGFAYIDSPQFKPNELGYNTGIDMASASMPQDPVVKAQVLSSIKGYLKAWDPISKKEVWHVEHEGIWNGGVLSTAGGLVFQGDSAGNFVAYGARDGKPLWSFSAQTGVIAAPMSFSVAGAQYVAVVVGWGGAVPLTGGEVAKKGSLGINRSRILAFRLGATGALPPPKLENDPQPKPPERFGDEATIAQGKQLYSHFCGTCHGDTVVGGGVVPDLRSALAIRSTDEFAKIVLGGTLKDAGMVSFSGVLAPAQAEAIRAYVVARANDPR
jgi:PQQ-dependent dehydrogenase (methanol/ethanol family)